MDFPETRARAWLSWALTTVFAAATGLLTAKVISTARESDRAAEHANRCAERVRRYDLLHTNVLTTLTLVARSGDTLSGELRSRCAQDAEHLRSVVRSVADPEPASLTAALTETIFERNTHGLNVHYSSDELPETLPADVLDAITRAINEALNNVAKHAGTPDVWVVATGEPNGELVVTITDRGVGFHRDGTRPGPGLSESIRRRLNQIGGDVEVRSHPGSGTSIEIRWRDG
jgi:signal transduction histidine kinase